ncbi:hypothetical protein M9Y10_018438 [Tritrichomonas musculus]|uniref:Uncharacterized protein n=1 Tax=Tritrichomonas musculus TaxID=1915356 RepID=A0ABR2HN43_9EUKA
MEYEKQYKDIVENIDHNSFDSLMKGMEKLMDLLENMDSHNADEEFIMKALMKTQEIKDEASESLKKEGQTIFKLAAENGISLSELGLSESDILFESS